MNRIVWIFRIAGLALLVVFVLTMMNLHRKLVSLRQQRPAAERVVR